MSMNEPYITPEIEQAMHKISHANSQAQYASYRALPESDVIAAFNKSGKDRIRANSSRQPTQHEKKLLVGQADIAISSIVSFMTLARMFPVLSEISEGDLNWALETLQHAAKRAAQLSVSTTL